MRGACVRRKCRFWLQSIFHCSFYLRTTHTHASKMGQMNIDRNCSISLSKFTTTSLFGCYVNVLIFFDDLMMQWPRNHTCGVNYLARHHCIYMFISMPCRATLDVISFSIFLWTQMCSSRMSMDKTFAITVS